MTIIVTCACGRLVECSGSEGGQWVRCPACGRELEIPRIGPPAGREPAVDWRPPPMAPASPPTPTPAPTNAKAIASLGLGLIFFLGCLSGLPAIGMGIRALRELRESKWPARGRRLAIAGIALGVFNCLLTVAFLLPAFRSAGEAARRAQCTNNLKQIGLAMHNYLEANDGCLPPAAITDRNGRPLLSWRVLILPYLEQKQLFTQFHLDEPWDSPHNRTLLEKTPDLYRCPSDRELPPGMTGYQVVVGPDTPFPPDGRPVKIGEITDGASNTLLVGESRHVVPWTKPDDQSPGTILLPDRGLGSHHGYHNNGFNALFVDASVHFLKSTIDRGVLEALTTRNGNEAISRDQF